MEYKNFEEFYNKAYSLVCNIKSNTVGFLANQRVSYARSVIHKSELRSFIEIGLLNKEVVNELGSKTPILKLSIDNMVKNIIVHSDITLEDYKKIPLISSTPSKFIKSKNNYDVILFKSYDKYYKLVVKTTKNMNENYVKSFHLLEQERYEKY